MGTSGFPLATTCLLTTNPDEEKENFVTPISYCTLVRDHFLKRIFKEMKGGKVISIDAHGRIYRAYRIVIPLQKHRGSSLQLPSLRHR